MSHTPFAGLVQVFSVPHSLLFLEGQVPHYRSRNLPVTIMCAPGPEADDFARRNNCRLLPVPFRRTIAPLQDLRCLLIAYRVLRKQKPLLVHTNTPKAGLIGTVAAWLARVPVRVYELHGLPLESRRGGTRWLLWLAEWLSCRLATTTVAISPSLRRQALTWALPGRIRVLENGSCNGVDASGRFRPDRFGTAQLSDLRRDLCLPGRVIGFVGRLTRDKGIRELAEAWQQLRTQYADLTLLLIGSSELGKLAGDPRIRRLFRDPRVRRLDFVPDIERYYALLDILVLPTYREGLSQVLLEAAAMQVAVVASRVTGTVDAVVENETGLFCQPRSAESLAQAVSRYLDNPDLIRQHGQNARKRVLALFRPQGIWEAKYRLYEQLAREAGFPLEPSANPAL